MSIQSIPPSPPLALPAPPPTAPIKLKLVDPYGAARIKVQHITPGASPRQVEVRHANFERAFIYLHDVCAMGGMTTSELKDAMSLVIDTMTGERLWSKDDIKAVVLGGK